MHVETEGNEEKPLQSSDWTVGAADEKGLHDFTIALVLSRS